jgi:hypothetical protein
MDARFSSWNTWEVFHFALYCARREWIWIGLRISSAKSVQRAEVPRLGGQPYRLGGRVYRGQEQLPAVQHLYKQYSSRSGDCWKETREDSVPLTHPSKELSFTLKIDVSPSGVTTYIQQNGSWEKVDFWTASGFNPASGKFGFYLRGIDRVYMSNCSFKPNVNTFPVGATSIPGLEADQGIPVEVRRTSPPPKNEPQFGKSPGVEQLRKACVPNGEWCHVDGEWNDVTPFGI